MEATEKLIFGCRRLLTQDGVNDITALDTRLLESVMLQVHINSIALIVAVDYQTIIIINIIIVYRKMAEEN